MAHLLIIDSRYYEEIASELHRGAVQALEGAGATHDHITVPGALEVPGAMAMAIEAMDRGTVRYDGFVALGCVIRGETTHYDIVAEQSARAIMDIAVAKQMAVGNGILTVENRDQALARARVDKMNKGGAAAEAALAMIGLRDRFGLGQ